MITSISTGNNAKINFLGSIIIFFTSFRILIYKIISSFLFALTPHQLSELINMHLGMNFTRLVKMHRVREAKDLLLDRPSTSALDIGLSVGFTSLSAFYAAFRELEGMAPGQFRKQARPSATD